MAELVKHCHARKMRQAKARRFMFSVRDPIVGEFNHHLQIGSVALIDDRTSFQNVGFIDSMDVSTAWGPTCNFWIDMHAGAPNYISTDAGTKFNSTSFKEQKASMGSIVKIIRTEAHERIGLVERSHAYLQTVYDKLRMDPPSISRKTRLSMSFRAINSAPSSESGILKTTLVFGIQSKIPGGRYRGSMFKRAEVIRKYTNTVTKMKARRIIRDCKKTRNVASSLDIQKVKMLQPGSDVLVYRENRDGNHTRYYVFQT